jgi:hypothetical protein
VSPRCWDLALALPPGSGALAGLGEALGKAGISVEGGGLFQHGGVGVLHFLFHGEDGPRAKAVAESLALPVLGLREPLVRRLRQEVPGQLGALARALAAASVELELLYSDHAGRLILLTDQPERAAAATAHWSADDPP